MELTGDARVLLVPESVKLLDDKTKLVYSSVMKQRSPEPGILGRFTGLAEESPERFLAFAREWGVLGIFDGFPPYPQNSSGVLQENLATWRSYAREARSLLNVALRLQRGETGNERDWSIANQEGYRPGSLDAEERAWEEYAMNQQGQIVWEKKLLSRRVSRWLRKAAIRPVLVWHPEQRKPHINIGAAGTFGLLAFELALGVAGSTGLVTCTACGNAYVPRRKPRIDERHYCPTCGKRAADKDAVREYRQKKKREVSDNA